MDAASIASAGRGWRLVLPLSAIVAIVAIASSLLYAAQVFERTRQEQRLIADTLWAEQAVSYEANRIVEGLRSLGRVARVPAADSGREGADELGLRIGALMQRSPALLSVRVWPLQRDDAARGPLDATLQALASRASRLREAATLEVAAQPGGEALLRVAVALPGAEGHTALATVSLSKLLQNVIPWWLAHDTQITLEDAGETVLAVRDAHVQGRGVYVHKIAAAFVDRTLYLKANSTQGPPVLIPNVLALAIACLSALLAWTVYALWRDLGRRTHAEAALRAQQAFRESMERSLVTGLHARGMDGRITHANRAFCDMLGCRPEQVVGQPAPYAAEADAGDAADRMFETRLQRSDGSSIDLRVHEAPLLDGSGTQIGWMASVQDISEQKRNAELLRVQGDRIQRMARLMTMGEMASALAHELNQPLAAATSYLTAGLNLVEQAGGDAGADATASGYFAKARGQTQRAGEIIKRVRQFVGHSTPNLAALDVLTVLRELVPLIKLQALDAEASISIEYDASLPPVLADRVLLEQIVLNLTRNAIEAVSGLAPPLKRVEIFGCSAADSRRAVVLGVRDRGPGLGAEGLRALGSTFNTTKPGGLGMGLAVCRKAAELLGSSLEYAPRPDGGAEFRLELKVHALP